METTTNVQYIARPDGRVAFDVDGVGPLVVLIPGWATCAARTGTSPRR